MSDASNQIVALDCKCFATGVVKVYLFCVRLLWFSTGDSALDNQQVADSRIRLLNCEQLLDVFQQKAQEAVAELGHQHPAGDAVRVPSLASPSSMCPPCKDWVTCASKVISNIAVDDLVQSQQRFGNSRHTECFDSHVLNYTLS